VGDIMAEKAKKQSKILITFKQASKFFNDMVLELKKVSWPTKNQVIKNTISVLVYCLIIGVIIWICDTLLMAFIKLVL